MDGTAVAQQWAGFLHSLPPSHGDLACALAVVRGAYRDDIWEAIAGKDLIASFMDAGFMGTSGPFRLVLLDHPLAPLVPTAAFRHVADRLVDIARQRSPTDVRMMFDAHELYFRISAWPQAWEALTSTQIEPADRYKYNGDLFRRWWAPVDGGLSPACRLPPRQAAEFVYLLEVISGEPIAAFLNRPEFATLADSVDTDYLAYLSLERMNDHAFAQTVKKLAFHPQSEEALNIRFVVLQRAIALAYAQKQLPAREIADELVKVGEQAGAEGRQPTHLDEHRKANRYDLLALRCLDNAANLRRMWGDFDGSLELTRRVEPLTARLPGYSRERGGVLADRVITGVRAREGLGVAEARFVLSTQQFVQSGLPNDIVDSIQRLGDLPHHSVARSLLDGECRYIDDHPYAHAIPGYLPRQRTAFR